MLWVGGCVWARLWVCCGVNLRVRLVCCGWVYARVFASMLWCVWVHLPISSRRELACVHLSWPYMAVQPCRFLLSLTLHFPTPPHPIPRLSTMGHFPHVRQQVRLPCRLRPLPHPRLLPLRAHLQAQRQAHSQHVGGSWHRHLGPVPALRRHV